MTCLNRRHVSGPPAATVLAPGGALAQPRRGDGRRFRIHMVVWRGETDVERGFQAYLRERGILADVRILDLARDKARIPEVLAEIRAEQPDLVHTWGTSTSLGIFGSLEDEGFGTRLGRIPGMFSLVAYPIESGLVESFDDPGRQLTGTAYLPSVESQMNVLFDYRNWQAVGQINNRLEGNSLINLEGVRRVSRQRGFTLHEALVPLDGEGRPDAAALPDIVREFSAKGVECIYIGPDSFVSVNAQAVTDVGLALGIPSFAGTEFGFENSSALLGLVSRYFLVGKLAGLQAERILIDRLPPDRIPVASLARYTLLIRMPVARRLGLYPPMQILPLAEVVG